MPTEAEWEKAARGTDGTHLAMGEQDACLIEPIQKKLVLVVLQELDNSRPQGDSPYGCVDMIGNVWEWCSDRFDENEYKKRANKKVYNPIGAKKGV